MTATITVRANHRAVSVLRQDGSEGGVAQRFEPHTSHDFTLCDDQVLIVREIHDDGAGDRPVEALDPVETASE